MQKWKCQCNVYWIQPADRAMLCSADVPDTCEKRWSTCTGLCFSGQRIAASCLTKTEPDLFLEIASTNSAHVPTHELPGSKHVNQNLNERNKRINEQVTNRHDHLTLSDFGLCWRSCSRYRSERAVRTLLTGSSMTAGSFLLDFNVIFPC